MIVKPRDDEAWLDPGLKMDDARAILKPYPASHVALDSTSARAALNRERTTAVAMCSVVKRFRHTVGTRLYEQTGDLNRVAAYLGHASPETSRVYAHMNKDALRNDLEDW